MSNRRLLLTVIDRVTLRVRAWGRWKFALIPLGLNQYAVGVRPDCLESAKTLGCRLLVDATGVLFCLTSSVVTAHDTRHTTHDAEFSSMGI